ncbi:alpha-2,8-sialyltransferase 8B-like [Branchiostoma floridae x Branchiostoma japonicum]
MSVSLSSPRFPTLMDRISAHFNETNIKELQKYTTKYLSPKRHIINFSDFDVFLEKCDVQMFTLLNSFGKRTCDVVHTPIRTHSACAIVGSSGALLGSSCGEEIDAHDFVIRPNLSPTLFYEKDVGSKNNMTTVNDRVLKEISQALTSTETAVKKAMVIRLTDHPGMVLSYPLDVLRAPSKKVPLAELKTVAKAVRDNNLPVVVTFAHQSVMKSKRLYASQIWGGKTWSLPSTGINTFALASTFCDRISLYGFSPIRWDNNTKSAVPYHYYGLGKMDNPNHILWEEFAMYQDLHKRGIIRHVIGKCNLK